MDKIPKKAKHIKLQRSLQSKLRSVVGSFMPRESCVLPGLPKRLVQELNKHSESITNLGPALTAVWSKAPPLTVRCLSPLSGFESWSGLVRKLPVTWG